MCASGSGALARKVLGGCLEDDLGAIPGIGVTLSERFAYLLLLHLFGLERQAKFSSPLLL